MSIILPDAFPSNNSINYGTEEANPNIIDSEECNTETQPQTSFGIIMIILVIVGLIGNLMVFSIIVILQEYKKSVTNWYILQLTCADTLFLLMLPFTAQSEITGKWDFSLNLCKFKEAVIFINYYASIYFLVVMSFDRYLAVTKAFATKKWVVSLRSPIASHIFSVIGWTLSVLLCIQLFQYSTVTPCGTCKYDFSASAFGFDDVAKSVQNKNQSLLIYADYLNLHYYTEEEEQVDESVSANFTCGASSDKAVNAYKVWVYGNFIGAFCLPFFLICFFYGMIMKTITAASQVGNVERQRSYRKRVTMIVMALVTLFLISWLPWYVEKLVSLNGLSISPKNCKTLENTVRILSYLNNALNPYFYSFLGAHFRQRLMRASTRVGLSRFRSRTTAGSFIKRHKRSTSNSGGSGKPSNKNQCTAPADQEQQDAFQHAYENEDPKFSVAHKTERTLVL